jgi:hypothetical protein
LNCRVIQSTSEEASGLLAYVAHYLEAHHSPRTLSTFFSTLYLELHCICVWCWDELAIGWHPDADIRYSFAVDIEKRSPSFC